MTLAVQLASMLALAILAGVATGIARSRERRTRELDEQTRRISAQRDRDRFIERWEARKRREMPQIGRMN